MADEKKTPENKPLEKGNEIFSSSKDIRSSSEKPVNAKKPENPASAPEIKPETEAVAIPAVKIAEKTKDEANAKEAKKKHGKIFIISAAAVCVCAAIICAVLFLPGLLGNTQVSGDDVYKDETFSSGVTVNGVDISGKTVDEAMKALQNTEKQITGEYKNLFLTYEDKKIEVTSADLGITYNTKTILNRIMKRSLSGEENISGEIKAIFSFDGVKEKLKTLGAEIKKDPVDASDIEFNFETRTFSYTDGENGVSLNENATLSALAVYLGKHKEGEIAVTADIIKGKGTEDDLLNRLGEMASFSTYCYNTYNAAHNMGLAMEKMNGSIIEPGETFSFHGAVGNSTTAAGGWLQAGAWSGGKLIQDYGGGICQAATTLYNCALYAGLDIVERACHLQPSSYCDIGLDATVDYPGLDCKVRNNTDYPIYVVSGMDGITLTMTMYGYKSEEWDDIQLGSQRTGFLEMPDPIFQMDSSLADGEFVRERSGMTGATATASRSFYKDGVCVRYEALPSSYYSSVAPIYRIGNNTDTSAVSGESGSALIETSKPESSKPESSTPESSTPESSTPESSSEVESSVPESSTEESSLLE